MDSAPIDAGKVPSPVSSDLLVLAPSTKDKKPSAGKQQQQHHHHHPPSSGCHRTEVVVDVHPGPRTEAQPMEGGGGGQAPKIRGPPTQSPGGGKQQTLVVPGKSSAAAGESGVGGAGSVAQRQSMSLEMPSLTAERSSPHQTRRVRSYEENRAAATGCLQLDYDRNKITQFIRKPLFNNDPTDEKECPAQRSKVRYNDAGSFEEEIDEDKEPENKAFVENKRFPVYEKKKLQVLKEADNEEVKDEGQGQSGGGGRAAENYQEIWTLRATFEEEEDEKGDESRAEDTSSEDSQPPQPTTMAIDDGSHRIIMDDRTAAVYHKKQPGMRPSSSGLVIPGPSLLFPESYSRRQTYRNVIARRMCRIEAPPVDVTVRVPPPPPPPPSAPGHVVVASSSSSGGINRLQQVENSFDSAETQETDGEISDASRHDLTTTSFESTTTTTTTTTENTDSTGDGGAAAGHNKGGGGIRGDSGYKSLEGQQSLSGTRAAPPGGPASSNVLSPPSAVPPLLSPFSSLTKIPEVTLQEVAERRTAPRGGGGGCGGPPPHRPTPTGVRSGAAAPPFDRRSSKTASKKRRDYRSERHVAAFGSVGVEPGHLCSSTAEHSGDSFEDCPPPTPASPSQRLSVFPRFLRSHIRAQGGGGQGAPHRRPPPRDYSVDEKTDALFNEFLRYDPNLDRKSSFRSFPGFHRWQRVHCSSTGGGGGGGGGGHHQHSDNSSLDVCLKRRHLRLSGNLRTTAFDCGATASFHRISPQDSIEEELSASAIGTTEAFCGREPEDIEQASVTNSN